MRRKSPVYCPRCSIKLKRKLIEDKKRLFCSECGWVNYENPLPSSAAFVRNDSGEILLVKRGVDPGRGEWALPSGFIEVNETPARACVRELKEETGLDGRIQKLLGVYSQKSSMYKNVIIIAYLVQADGVLRPGSDSVNAEYFAPNKLPAIAFPSHVEILKDGIKS
jgi:8-oxo-dGTP diphosphatase